MTRREELEEWVSLFLWHFHDSGMGNGEAAEIIVSTMLSGLPAEQLPDPEYAFQKWKDDEAERAAVCRDDVPYEIVLAETREPSAFIQLAIRACRECGPEALAT